MGIVLGKNRKSYNPKEVANKRPSRTFGSSKLIIDGNTPSKHSQTDKPGCGKENDQGLVCVNTADKAKLEESDVKSNLPSNTSIGTQCKLIDINEIAAQQCPLIVIKAFYHFIT